MTTDPQSTDCLLRISDPSFERLLVSQSDAGSALPRVTVEAGFYAYVRPVLDAARRQWGLDVNVLRCLANQKPGSGLPGLREYSAYCHNPSLTLPNGLRWVSVGEVEALLSSSSRLRVPRPRHETGQASGLPNTASRVPWERGEGWSAEAMGWIRRALGRLGLASESPPRQLRVWSISTVYTLPTSSGRLVFKASPDYFPAEAALTEELSRRFPLNTPRVLAADHDRNWLLMADLGETRFDTVADEALWQEAMRVTASMQIDYINRVVALESMRLERKALEDLPSRLARWANQAESSGRESAFQDAQLLAQQMGLIKDLCAELASFAIPETLEHGDLDAGNIFLSDGRPVLMDWSDSSISHPFFTVALLGRAGVPCGPRLDAYMRPWSAFETEARLRRAYSVARPLAALERALHYIDDNVPNTDQGVDRREMEAILSLYARMAVKSLEPWT